MTCRRVLIQYYLNKQLSIIDNHDATLDTVLLSECMCLWCYEAVRLCLKLFLFDAGVSLRELFASNATVHPSYGKQSCELGHPSKRNIATGNVPEGGYALANRQSGVLQIHTSIESIANCEEMSMSKSLRIVIYLLVSNSYGGRTLSA